MLKIMSLSLIAVVINLSVYAFQENSSKHINSYESNYQMRVLNIGELDETILNEMIQGKHPEIAIEFSTGTIIPINFFLKGDLVSLVEENTKLGKMKIQQTFYARCVNDELILSSNLIEWKPLFEFVTGKASITFHIVNERATLIIGSETNKRI